MATDYEKAHNAQMARYAAMVGHIYTAAAKDAAVIGASVTGYGSSEPFSFSRYPLAAQRIKNLLNQLYSDLNTVILDGVEASWTLANNKNNELSRMVFGNNIGKLSEDEYRRYFTNNDTALAAFVKRKEDGLGISDRVWQYTKQYKGEIELALDLGISQGKSAAGIARDLRQYLNNPDALYRRVRDKYGNLHLSQHAAAYHPGPGVYRSAVRNAQRLSRTENNMAYRTADYLRWQEADYVVGIEIMLSNNHTTKNHKGEVVPLEDICDELRGRYPKTFHFRGWHPHCRCKVVPITKTKEEMEKDTADILAGKKPGTDSINRVNDVPEAFKNWTANNTERFAKSAGQPYFIRDNFVDGNITQGLKHNISPQQAAPVPAPATQRQQRPAKTPAQADAIKARWEARRRMIEQIKANAAVIIEQIKADYPDIDTTKLRDYLNTNRINEAQNEILSLTAQIDAAQHNQADKHVLRSVYPKATAAVVKVEEDIRKNKTFETAVVYDDVGNMVLRKKGKRYSVSLTDNEIRLIKDKVLTHNHPGGWKNAAGTLGRIGNSFSRADVKTAISSDVAEIRAVTPLYTFSLRRPAGGWGMSEAQFIRAYNDLMQEYERRLFAMYHKAKSVGLGNMYAERVNATVNHLFWKEFSKKYGFEYVKTKSAR